MLILGGWRGTELQAKGWNTKWKLDTVKAQKTAWQGYIGSSMAEMEQNEAMNIWTANKTSNNSGYCQPRHLPVPVPETTIQAFHITVNSPLSRLKFRLETNSMVIW